MEGDFDLVRARGSMQVRLLCATGVCSGAGPQGRRLNPCLSDLYSGMGQMLSQNSEQREDLLHLHHRRACFILLKIGASDVITLDKCQTITSHSP